MTLYNVSASVVDLIHADTAQGAIAELQDRLRAAGFDPYDGDPGNAFESEEIK